MYALSCHHKYYFENNKLAYDSQYGFRPNHCTEQATLELTDRIISAMDNNDVPIGISFKSVRHNRSQNTVKQIRTIMA